MVVTSIVAAHAGRGGYKVRQMAEVASRVTVDSSRNGRYQ